MLALLMALRWLFYGLNASLFPAIGPSDVWTISLQGLRFDAMTLVVANCVYILLCLLPHPWHGTRWFSGAMLALYVVVNALVLLACCIDLPFYGFTGKRITRDVLGQLDAGLRELPLSLIRYWWAGLAYTIAVFVLIVGARRSGRVSPAVPDPWPKELGLAVIGLAIFFVIGRGGWQYQGLSPAHAADHVDASLAPLVTNSAFTFGYSINAPAVVARRYMTDDEMRRLAPLSYTLERDSSDTRRNVVLLIVESLGREYVSAISGEAAYMPFLDSLCRRSLALTNAFANAEGSSKGTCAILAGIPSFTDEAFMNTAYSGNRVDGLGSRLKEMGYATAYFHGGLNGEFKFDSFSRACGFDSYFGKDEFGDDRFYDEHWGIYDEEFLQFTAERISSLPQPFCAGIFTLSTHDPFPIPERYSGHFPKGTQEIHESLGYADMAIRRFFERASQEPWYRNTLFVITADHTFKYNEHPAWYMNPAGRFAVPILFFAPDGSFTGTDDRVAQQLDIMPSILDLMGYEGRISTFGQSVFQRDRWNRAAMHVGGLFQLAEDDRMLLFDGNRSKGLFAYRTDTLFAHDLSAAEPSVADSLERQLKALIQRHAEALLNNALVEH